MAIDGPKIIDSDLAHDIYNEFMDLYDFGLDISKIREKIEEWKSNLADDLEVEIFNSVYCEALWEIGELNKVDVVALENIVQNESGFKLWKNIDIDLYNARKKILQRQLLKISKCKSKVRNRKKYRSVTNFHFQVGDCLAYRNTTHNSMQALLVFDIEQHRGECLYSMAIITNNNSDLNSIKFFINGQFIGRKIPSTLDPNGFYYGFSCVRPEHRVLMKYIDCFTYVGTISLRKDNTGFGSFGGILTQRDLDDDLNRLMSPSNQKIFNDMQFNMREIIELTEKE